MVQYEESNLDMPSLFGKSRLFDSGREEKLPNIALLIAFSRT